MSKARLLLLPLFLLSLSARAESNRFNLHLMPGLHLSGVGIGADVGVGFDWQFMRGLGLDVRHRLRRGARLSPRHRPAHSRAR